jgi:fatty acid desaturase
VSFAEPISLPGHFGSDGDGPKAPVAMGPHVVWAVLAALAAALATWWIGWRVIPILTSVLGVVVVGLLVRHPEISGAADVARPGTPHIRLVSASWSAATDEAPRQAPSLRVVTRPASDPR